MRPTSNPPATDKYQGLIAYKAARMSHQSGFTPSDADDIAQELRIKVLQAQDRHDQARGDEAALVHTSVEHRSANMVRDRNAACRRSKGQVSLSITVKTPASEISELAAEIGQQHLEARTGATSRSNIDAADLRDDVEACIEQLDTDQQRIVRAVMQFSVAEAARYLRMPRTNLQRRLAAMRELFEQSEMREYLS